MKVFASLVVLCLVSSAYTLSATATMMCQYVTTNNQCAGCFSWGSGSKKARSLASNTCTAILTSVVTDAKFYNGTHKNADPWAWSSAGCKSDKHLVVDKSTGVASPYTATCTKTAPTGAVAIANCDYTNFEKTSSTAATAKCMLCKKGHGGVSGHTACSATAIANCDHSQGTDCYYCKSKFAVANAGTSCTAFTTDGNCRKLHTDSTCTACWEAYYFDATKCKLFANLIAAGAALAISAFLF